MGGSESEKESFLITFQAAIQAAALSWSMVDDNYLDTQNTKPERGKRSIRNNTQQQQKREQEQELSGFPPFQHPILLHPSHSPVVGPLLPTHPATVDMDLLD
jgi:hypothetical protein